MVKSISYLRSNYVYYYEKVSDGQEVIGKDIQTYACQH